MASIGGAIVSKKAKAARAQRFAAEASTGVPPAPARRVAHPDFGARIVRSDPEEKLLALLARRLGAGHALTAPQQAALRALGLAEADVRAQLAAAPPPAAPAAPSIYAELGMHVAPLPAALPAPARKHAKTAANAGKPAGTKKRRVVLE